MRTSTNSHEQAAAIYDRAYADSYEMLYLRPWSEKHRLNVENVTRLSQQLRRQPIRWLDTCCGQAWCFSQFGDEFKKTGVDVSPAQLEAGSPKNRAATFIWADIADVAFRPGSFDLITNFWASYCYLNGRKRIREFVSRCAHWTREGGAIYFELLLPEDLERFNSSLYSEVTGFKVEMLSRETGRWSFVDFGGRHHMASPPLEAFTEILERTFQKVEAHHDGRFMVHLMASGRF